MQKKDFYYDLPEHLIAQTPIEPRDSARMLVYNRATQSIEDKHFYNVLEYLKSGDVMVVNKTKVLPARIYGTKVDAKTGEATGAKIEFLLHKRQSNTEWETLAGPAKRAKIGDTIYFCDKLTATVKGEAEGGLRNLEFHFEGVFEEILDEIGETPLPHYIKEKLENLARYQTVYASDAAAGSAAAPTAGLHFTPELIQKIKDKGVHFVEILLHVGIGTFRPVKEDDVTKHKMHAEYYEVDTEAANIINAAKKEGRRVVAVGTTSVRTLESVADDKGFVKAQTGETDIYIYPPYQYKAVDALITNFHLPESTLVMLVSALLGREKTLEIYKHAVDNAYRFFSFGDACLFL